MDFFKPVRKTTPLSGDSWGIPVPCLVGPQTSRKGGRTPRPHPFRQVERVSCSLCIVRFILKAVDIGPLNQIALSVRAHTHTHVFAALRLFFLLFLRDRPFVKQYPTWGASVLRAPQG